MSIYYKNNQPHWYYDKNEICCKIPVAQLSKLLDEEISFDPRAIICAFKNGTELDREALDKLKGCDKPASIFSTLRSWILGLDKKELGASILVVKSGAIKFDTYIVSGLMSKDYSSLSCELTVSAKIENIERFILNGLSESNRPQNAISQTALIAREEDAIRLAEIRNEIEGLRAKRLAAQKKTSFPINISGEARSAQTEMNDCNKDIARLEQEERDIKARASRTYEREVRENEMKGVDYYVYNSEDLYLTLIGSPIEALLRNIAFTMSEDDFLANDDIALAVSQRLNSIPEILNKFSDAGIRVEIDSARVLNLAQSEISEKILETRKNLAATKWKVRLAKSDFEWAQLERETDKATSRLESDKELDKQAEANYKAKGIGELEASAGEDSLEISKKKSRTEMDQKELEVEKLLRFNAIENLQNRIQIKSDYEAKWFVKELERQDIINADEMEKLQISIGWNREDAEEARRLAKKDASRQGVENDWDFENKKLKNDQFRNALLSAMAIEEAKAAEALKNVSIDAERERAFRDLDDELLLKSKRDSYLFSVDERADKIAFERKSRDDYYAADLEKRHSDDSFLSRTRESDYADEREERRNRIQFEKDERERLSNEDSADRAQEREEKTRKAQMDAFEQIQRSEERKREQIRQEKRDEYNANLESKRLDREAEVEISRQQKAVELEEKRLANAHLASDEHKAKAEAEAKAAAMEKVLLEMKMEREYFDKKWKEENDRRREERREDFLLERDTKMRESVEMRKHELALEELKLQRELAKSEAEKQKQERDDAKEIFDAQRKDAHEERMAELNSEARVSNARYEELSMNRAPAPQAEKPKAESKMLCDKCNRYFQEEFAICPLCGNKLRKVIL